MASIRRILHPSDFSKASGAAFVKAVELAKSNRADLVVLHVLAPPLPLMAGDGTSHRRSTKIWTRRRELTHPRSSPAWSRGRRRPVSAPPRCCVMASRRSRSSGQLAHPKPT
jgi:nucleotide-binding universal stress UspA family protein